MPPHHTIDRTSHVPRMRVTACGAAHTGTVPSGSSASENAEGAGRWQRTGAFSRNARATETVRRDSEVTAVPQRTRMPVSGDTGTPTSRREVAA